MKVTGLTIKQTGSVNYFTLTETFTKGSGKMIKPMVKVLILTQTVLVIKEIGEMINSTDSVSRLGLMVRFTKANTLRAKRTVKASLLSPMAQFTMEISK
jgi:hypothetical protein